MSRPAPAEWSGDHGDAELFAHGTPLLIGGRLQAGRRDASFIACPDTRRDKAAHIAVVSHRIGLLGGVIGLAAACDPVRIMLLDDPTRDAMQVHPNGRCARPGCKQLFAQAVKE